MLPLREAAPIADGSCRPVFLQAAAAAASTFPVNLNLGRRNVATARARSEAFLTHIHGWGQLLFDRNERKTTPPRHRGHSWLLFVR